MSAVILALVVTGFGTIAYRSVRISTLEAAAERLTTVAQVFNQAPAVPPAWIRENQAVARHTDVIDIVRSHGQRVSDTARALIASLTPDTGQTLATDIRDLTGAVLFAVTSPVADSLAGAPSSDRSARTGGVVQAGSSAARSPVRLQ